MSKLIELSPTREASAQPAFWFATYTRSNFEKVVSAELTQKGFDSYLPVVVEVHRWKDRTKKVEVPLFPGYVFVRMDDSDDQATRILRTTGVVQFVGPGKRREPIPDIEIRSIRRLLDSQLAFCRHEIVRKGDYVRVKRGPLRGAEGHLLRVKSQNRLILSVEMLSQAISVEIDVADIEVILRPIWQPRLIA